MALLLHSPSPIRHAFYETFVHLHFIFAAASFGLLWVHLHGLTAKAYLIAAIVLWALEVSFDDAVLPNDQKAHFPSLARGSILHNFLP